MFDIIGKLYVPTYFIFFTIHNITLYLEFESKVFRKTKSNYYENQKMYI